VSDAGAAAAGPSVVELGSPAAAPETGIHSQTLHADASVRVILFGFAAGEELSEHTSSRPATIQVLSGAFDVTVGGRAVDGRPGTLICMPPGTPHSLRARTPAQMLLTLAADVAGGTA
jgi:quercetin dioxygenase-like cupin family protein